jgi:hypothetical protein
VPSVKLVLMLWTGVTVYLIYRLGIVVADRWVGIMAAVFAGMLFSQIWLAGTNSKIESFVTLPQVAAVLILMSWLKKPDRSRPLFFAGFFGAVTFLFKVNYLSPLVIAAAVLVVELWRNREEERIWSTTVARGLWLGIGFLAGVLPVVAYFTALGLLPRLLQVFTIGFSYTQLRNPEFAHPAYLVIYPLVVLARNNAVILMCGLAGLIFVLASRLRTQSSTQPQSLADGRSTAMIFIALWFLLVFVETGASRVFLLNYYLVFVPPLTLLAAWFVRKLYRDVRQQLSRAPSLAVMAPLMKGTLLLAILLLSLWSHAAYYKHYYLGYLPGLKTYTEFLIAGLPDNAGETAVALQELADYLAAHTGPDDTIYYWSNLMQLYYMADRRAVIDIVWPLYLDATGPRERIFQARYIIVGDTPLGYTESPDWFREGLAQYYELEIVLHQQALYRRLP